MTLTKYGIREWGSALIATILLEIGCYFLIYRFNCPRLGWWLGAFFLIVFLAGAAFFRNPRRKIPADPDALISPADGTVKDIGIVEDFDFPPFNGKALRIGIFLSVLNVHVNRTPAEMEVLTVNYRPGEYLDARHPECGKRNEAMTIIGNGKLKDFTFPMAVRQISGAIARRIVCPVQPGRRLDKGEIYGMIKFGSRTELYLPADQFSVEVKIGDKVKGGLSILARRS